MIKIGSKEISGIGIGSKAIVAVYKGAQLVWQSVTSCFGSGYWINNYPWKNTDGWKN